MLRKSLQPVELSLARTQVPSALTNRNAVAAMQNVMVTPKRAPRSLAPSRLSGCGSHAKKNW